MNLFFQRAAWEDYLYWQGRGDSGRLSKINNLIENTLRTPRDGIGKPEALKGNLTGYWSRRIDREHRFVYRIREIDGHDAIEIVQLRHHY